ncbi:MAG: PD40 domain-containing protein [Bacteroidales bacterium]|nr:PD40 domain-containing protein [Bacteroidales bacterium]
MGTFRAKIPTILLQLITLVIFPYAVTAQSSAEKKNIFTQAETFYLYEEYELANPLYILLETPDNMNIKYKIGTCYLNIPGEKEKAVSYLEEAVKNASYESKTNSYKEKAAPLDAYFSLAKAYMINNDLDKGLNTLETFRKLVLETADKGGMKNTEFIDQQIQACKIAISLKENPVYFSKKILGDDFSHGAINENPAVSFDGRTLVYTERRGNVSAIFFSRKENGAWLPPKDITTELVAGEDCSSCSLNSDGTELFLYKTDNYDGVIYSSSFLNGSWTPVRKLNKNINTKFYESHAAISYDGKRLYFTSNREGGLGNLDIYVSEKEATGDWGPAVNLGSEVNTPFNEDTPFITENDSAILFSSEGHSSMGGYDIFKSFKKGASWDTPVNMGFPINSTGDDKFFQPWNNDKNAYYSITTDYKKREIFYLILGGRGLDQYSEINGKLSLADTVMPFDKTFKIHLIDRSSGDTVDVSYPNKFTGIYTFYTLPGKYKIVYSGIGYFSQYIDTTVIRDNDILALNIDISLKRDYSVKRGSQIYDKINLNDIPSVSEVDPNILIKNLNVNDLSDENVKDSDILYYTVQVMALKNPKDMSFFRYIPDIQVMFNDDDKFYRYTTGSSKQGKRLLL